METYGGDPLKALLKVGTKTKQMVGFVGIADKLLQGTNSSIRESPRSSEELKLQSNQMAAIHEIYGGEFKLNNRGSICFLGTF